jgi:hypothetical protein
MHLFLPNSLCGGARKPVDIYVRFWSIFLSLTRSQVGEQLVRVYFRPMGSWSHRCYDGVPNTPHSMTTAGLLLWQFLASPKDCCTKKTISKCHRRHPPPWNCANAGTDPQPFRESQKVRKLFNSPEVAVARRTETQEPPARQSIAGAGLERLWSSLGGESSGIAWRTIHRSH